MDAFSEILSGVKLNGALFFSAEFSAPWGFSSPASKMLAPVLDFEKRSATEHYVETLPAPIQAAIKEKRAVEGMDKEQVTLALGRPRHKTRETNDGLETEDWIYGTPPGRVVFVTFDGPKVVKVKETYAGLGTAAPDLPVPR